MKAILIDSDILINVARGRDARLLERWTDSIHNFALWTHNRKHYPMRDCLFFSFAD